VPQPTPRIIAIDAVRGLSLIGIVLVNFSVPTYGGFRVAGPADALLQWMIRILLLERIYPLFALLFGVGLAIQVRNAAAAGRAAAPQTLRRLGALLLVGLANALLVIEGDVLHIYALCGLVAMTLWAIAPRALLPASAACWAALAFRPVWLPGAPAIPFLPTMLTAQGTFAEQVAARADLLVARFGSAAWLSAQLEVVSLILLGLWVGRAGFLAAPEQHRHCLRRAMWVSLGIAILGAVWEPFCRLAALVLPAGVVDRTLGRWSVEVAATTLQRPATAAFYGLAAFLFFVRPDAARMREAVGPLGRAALTAFLMQGFVGRWLFSSYGMSLYGMRYLPGELLALATAAILAAASAAWLRRYFYGPFEWLWRAATYLSWPPWRRAREPVPPTGS
jgi:uncharacterized protein